MPRTPQPPRCGRPKVKARLGNVLCLALRIKAPDGRTAPACQKHLTGKERAAYGIAHPGAVKAAGL